MNKRDKSKDEDKSDSKKAIGIILAAIMLASVFALIASADGPNYDLDITAPIGCTNVSGSVNIVIDNVSINAEYYYGPTNWTYLSTVMGGTYPWDTTNVSDGDYWIHVRNMNNHSQNATEGPIHVDNADPSKSVINPFAYVKCNDSLNLNVSITDTGTGVRHAWVNVSELNSTYNWAILHNASGYWENTTVEIDNIPADTNPGNKTMSLNISDWAGNWDNQSVAFTRFADCREPRITDTSVSPKANVTYDETITLSVTLTDLNATGTGNCSGIESVQVNVTKLNATATWLDLALNTTTGTIYNGTWNGTVHVNNSDACNKSYNLTINATDYSGNSNTSVNITITLDNQDPETVIPLTPWKWVTNCTYLNLSVNASDSCSGIEKVIVNASAINASAGDDGNVTLTLLGGTIYNETVHVNTPNTGQNYTLTIYAYDWAGNVNKTQNFTFFIDNTGPEVEPKSPQFLGNVSNCTILDLNVSVNDSGSGVHNVTVNVSWVNDTINEAILTREGSTDYWTNTTIHVNRSELNPGEGRLNITVYDNASNTNTTEYFTAFVDSLKPNITSIPAYAKNCTNLTLSVTVKDMHDGENCSGVKSVKVNVTKLNVSHTEWLNLELKTGTIYNGTWNGTVHVTNDTLCGDVNLTINATDYAGNSNISENFTVTIDNVEPEFVVNVTGLMCVKNCMDLNLSVNASDSCSEIMEIIVNASAINDSAGDAGNVTLSHLGGGIYNVTVHVNTTNNGTQNLTIYAYDNASNVNSSAQLQIFVDNIAPVVEAGPDQLDVAVNETLTFNASESNDQEPRCCNLTAENYSWDFGDGNTTSGIVVTHLYNTTGSRTVTLTVTDCAGNNGTDTLLVSVTHDLFDIQLSGSGWNLISTPLMPHNETIENVIANISANLTAVWAYRYNSTSGSMEWLWHTPAEAYDTLDNFEAGWGYWVNMTSADTLTLTIKGTFFPIGHGPPPPTYDVYTGWNLVGFHSQTNKNASIYLANLGTDWSTLYKYPFGGAYEQILANENMERGFGYWLSMQANGTIAP